jgi:hypothetical protein
MHLDEVRGQMVAMLEGTNGPPPESRSVRDPGDLFLVLADIFPANGTVARVVVDLSELDMRWGGGAVSGVSALAVATYYVNAVGGNVPSTQAVYGIPLNGSAPIVVPYGADANLDHLFYSTARGELLVVTTDGAGAPSLARFSPPSPVFTRVFSWNVTGGLQDFGLYDVSPDGSKMLSVLVNEKGLSPVLVVLDLVHLTELARIPLKGFSGSEAVCDISWCNV